MVPDAQTVTARLEGALSARGCPSEVINGGTAAYSTDQEYLFYREEGRRYASDVVVLFVYHNDLPYLVLDDYLGLPRDHPGRSPNILREAVIDRLSPPRARLIEFDVDDATPVDACRRLDAEIAAAGGLDLIVLGLGRNGHVGVNEPGSSADSPTRVVELAEPTREAARRYGVAPPPTHGVTLGMASVLAARGDHQLSRESVRHAALLAEGDELSASVAAQVGLRRAGFVVEP